jgi:hypothetical protein
MMRFLHPYSIFKRHAAFPNVSVYDDVKEIVRRALDAEENFNLLFCGVPASGCGHLKENVQ